MATQDPVTDFDGLSWHDDTLYGLRFDVGDSFQGDWRADLAKATGAPIWPRRLARRSGQGDWRADLVLDIDHIVEWIRGEAGKVRFRVAPATLVFHGVTDLKIAIDWGDSGDRTALHDGSIEAITREPVANQEG